MDAGDLPVSRSKRPLPCYVLHDWFYSHSFVTVCMNLVDLVREFTVAVGATNLLSVATAFICDRVV